MHLCNSRKGMVILLVFLVLLRELLVFDRKIPLRLSLWYAGWATADTLRRIVLTLLSYKKSCKEMGVWKTVRAIPRYLATLYKKYQEMDILIQLAVPFTIFFPIHILVWISSIEHAKVLGRCWKEIYRSKSIKKID